MIAAALLAAATAGAAAPPRPAGVPSRYLVVERDSGGAWRTLWQTRVRLAAALDRGGTAASDSPEGEPLVATVRSAGGGILATRTAHPPRWLRGEFAGAGGVIEGFLSPLESAHVALRVPAGDDDRLELRSGDRAPVAVPGEIAGELDGVAETLRAAAEVAPIRITGSPANRLDVVIVGEGYTAALQAAFVADAHALAEKLLATSPYAEYRDFLNVAALFVPSPEEGADHPPYRSGCATGDPTCCADADAQQDPRAGTYAATAFDATFCTLGIHRLLTVNVAKVLVAASVVPDWDILLVLVNDPVYGGSGGQLPVTSVEARAPEIARHELGHSFALLADEYDTPFPGYPACSDLAGPPPCEPNVTDVLQRDAVKWLPWVRPETPIPTPASDPAFAAVVGLFEGARYLAAGMFRPRLRCQMRLLGRPFCEVCREAFVERLYRGGWGVPAAGIDLIDPGSERPPPGAVAATVGAPLELAVALLAPATDPALAVSWGGGRPPAPPPPPPRPPRQPAPPPGGGGGGAGAGRAGRRRDRARPRLDAASPRRASRRDRGPRRDLVHPPGARRRPRRSPRLGGLRPGSPPTSEIRRKIINCKRRHRFDAPRSRPRPRRDRDHLRAGRRRLR